MTTKFGIRIYKGISLEGWYDMDFVWGFYLDDDQHKTKRRNQIKMAEPNQVICAESGKQ